MKNYQDIIDHIFCSITSEKFPYNIDVRFATEEIEIGISLYQNQFTNLQAISLVRCCDYAIFYEELLHFNNDELLRQQHIDLLFPYVKSFAQQLHAMCSCPIYTRISWLKCESSWRVFGWNRYTGLISFCPHCGKELVQLAKTNIQSGK